MDRNTKVAEAWHQYEEGAILYVEFANLVYSLITKDDQRAYEEMTNDAVEREPERYYTGIVDGKGAKVQVFGWYGEQEWVEVELVKKTELGWKVRRVK